MVVDDGSRWGECAQSMRSADASSDVSPGSSMVDAWVASAWSEVETLQGRQCQRGSKGREDMILQSSGAAQML